MTGDTYARSRDFYVVTGLARGEPRAAVWVECRYRGNKRWNLGLLQEMAFCFLEEAEATKTARYLNKRKPGRDLRVVKVRVRIREQQVWPKASALNRLAFVDAGPEGV